MHFLHIMWGRGRGGAEISKRKSFRNLDMNSSSSLPRDATEVLCIRRQILDHWTTKEVLVIPFSTEETPNSF